MNKKTLYISLILASLLSASTAFGIEITLSYDRAGQLTSIDYPGQNYIDYSYDLAGNITEIKRVAAIVVQPGSDTDNDGIDDDWEIAHVPAGTPSGQELNVFTASGDYDGDGYSDYQEFLNKDTIDPLGASFDPLIVNAPSGVGYQSKSSFILMVLPAILSNATK